MRHIITCSFRLLILITAFSAAVSAHPSHQDKKYGYKITPPSGWSPPSRDFDISYVIAKFEAKTKTYYNDPEGWTWSHRPEMKVIAFVHETEKEEKPKVTGKDDDPIRTVTFSLKNPYKDYKAYMSGTYYQGGFYYSKEEESKLKDIPVTCYEIKVEKLTRTGPKRIIAWIYHLDDLDIAVHFEVLEKAYSKFRADISRSLKSFRVIEREGEIPTEEGTLLVSRTDWHKLPLDERKRRLKELEKEAHEKAIKELPKGWKHYKVGDYLVLDNYKAKMAKDVARHCQTVMSWLDNKFDYIGPDEYVRAPIVKVTRTKDLNSAVYSFGSSFDNIVIEYEHNPTFIEWGFEHVSRRALGYWFSERDRDLYWAMPYWISNGLEDLIENCRSKGKRLEFPEDVRDRVDLKQAHSKGTLTPPKDLIMMGRKEFYSGRWKTDEASALVRFLVIGPGSKSKRTKEIVKNYLINLAAVTAEIKKEEDEAGREKPKTEEEENEYFKNKKNEWKEKEERILQETFSRTFAGWTNKDWKAFTASYMRMVDG